MPVGCFRRHPNHGKESKGATKSHQTADVTSLYKTGVPESNAGTDIVQISRKYDDEIVGLIFSGGIDMPNKPHITNLRQGGLAARCDGLMVGDYITAINGILTERLKHMEIVTLLKNTSSRIQIQICFPLPPRAPQSAFSLKCRRTAITLAKEGSGVGLVIRGGSQNISSKSRPLTITYVRPGGSADRNGIIRVGDRIVAINGIAVITASLHTARRLIKESAYSVTLVVEYNITIMDTVQNAAGPLLVEITCGGSGDIGVTLKQKVIKGKPTIVIDQIQTASVAERCGALHVTDHIYCINGVDIGNMSAAEAEHFLITRNTEVLELEILPVGHLVTTNSVGAANYSTPAVAGSSQSFQLDASFYSVFSEDMAPVPALQSMSLDHRRMSTGPSRKQTLTYTRSVASSSSNGSRSIVSHEERMSVCLFANHIGIGIQLQVHSDQVPGETLKIPPYIRVLETNSSADRCGVLLEGDKVLAINGTDVLQCTLAECQTMLQQTSEKCVLDISFDVSDEIQSKSGVFQVKLCKKGGSIGVSLKEKATSDGASTIVISSVKKGSPAYRCGAIDIGDELLSVDSFTMASIREEDARQILQNTDEVVKLQIHKVPQKHTKEGEFVFTLELPKDNNSIGFTLHGNEELNQPITVTKITPGGVVERTGAVQVGDRIVSINGKSLRGKPVTYAIQQLKCGDVISLTISRDQDKKNGPNVQTTAKPQEHYSGRSKDSAVDSWDSQVSPMSHSDGSGRNQKENRLPKDANQEDNWSAVIEQLQSFGSIGRLSNETVKYASSTTSYSRCNIPLSHSTTSVCDVERDQETTLATNCEIVNICMHREENETFGFGLSDTLHSSHEGCYIKAVGKHSPAYTAGLHEYDRVIQVNSVDVQNHSCKDIVPIIENAGATLELVVLRNPRESGSTHSNSMVSHHQSSTDSVYVHSKT